LLEPIFLFFCQCVSPTSDGTYTVTYTVTDNNGASSSDSLQIIVKPLPTLSIADLTITEGEDGTNQAIFTVNLNEASTRPVTVNYNTANGTATAGNDYTATSGTLTFNPGTTTQTITVPITGDRLDEIDKNFSVNLTNPINASIADNIGIGTIIDNDPVPSISIDDKTITEGDSGSSNLTFTVSLSEASSKTITVNYSTANGTATAGNDYTATSGTLTFNPGTTTQIITMNLSH
jgi:large repetitive protein